MNKLLKVKLKFSSEPGPNGGGVRNLRSGRSLNIEKIQQLITDLQAVKSYFLAQKSFISGCLIDVYYDDVIAKSSRVQQLFKGKRTSDETIVGARFSDAPVGHENHIITHYLELEVIDKAIEKLQLIRIVLRDKLSGEANKENFNIEKNKQFVISFNGYKGHTDSEIRGLIVDCSVVEKFDVPRI